MLYWIHTSIENLPYLESLGIKLGKRVGEYWHDCTIPEEAQNDLYEHWGIGLDNLMFGEEQPYKAHLTFEALEAKPVRKAARLRR